MKSRQKILIIKNRAMGDAIMGLSAVTYIRSLYPQAEIYYAVPSWVAPLFKNIECDADEIFPLKLSSLKDMFKLWKDLNELEVDTIYEMHQAGRTGKYFSLYQFFHRQNVEYFFHNHHLSSGTKVIDQGIIKSVIQRDLDGVYSFLNHSNLNLPTDSQFSPKIKLAKTQEKITTDKIIIGVVATRETKMWGITNYISLMKLVRNDYLSRNQIYPKFIIPLSKSDVDEKLKDELLSHNTENLFTIEQRSLQDLPSIINGAQLYIGNDTGLKHLAVALGVKTYTFFGPEPPNEWHPYDRKTHAYFYRDELECRTRELHYCGLTTCPSMICLNEFTPQMAFIEIKKDLNYEL